MVSENPSPTKKQRAYQLGVSAEQRVAQYLIQERGYSLIHQRYRCCYGEIDLVMDTSDTVVFVEVKARKKIPHHGEVFALRHQKRVWNAAHYFISQSPQYQSSGFRFDLALVCGEHIHVIDNVLTASDHDGSFF